MSHSSNDGGTEMGRRWVEAWNSRDLEEVLELYDDNAEMVSPHIIRLGFSADGRLKGKAQLRVYWSRALAGAPDLHFTLLDIFESPDSIVVRYRNQRGAMVCEYLRFAAGGKIVQGSAHHLAG